MRWLFVSLTVVMAWAFCLAQKSEKKQSVAKLNFVVEGLHCENCVANLTKALKSVGGVQKAEVSLKEKFALVTLDESKTPVSNLIAQTHKQVPYRLTLLLPVENWDKVDRNKAVQVVKGVKGVSEAKADKLGLLVGFNPQATLRYSDLVEALAKNGFKVLNEPVKLGNHKHSGSQGNSDLSLQQNSCCSECESTHESSHSGKHHSNCP